MRRNKDKKLILAIDTTCLNTSCALTAKAKVVAMSTSCGFLPVTWKKHLAFLPNWHQEHLMENILILLKRNNVSWPQMGGIAVSAVSGVRNCVLVGTTVA